MDILTILGLIAGGAGSCITIITFATLVCKPLREKFIKWVRKITNREEIDKEISNVNEKIDKLTGLVEKTIDQNNKLQDETKMQSEALQASLRNSILKAYHCCTSRGYITSFQAQNVSALFTNYEKLGGNGFIKYTIMPAINRLPVKDSEGGE